MELLLPGAALVLFSVFILLGFAIWIYCLVDILRHNFSGQHEKLIWIILVVVVPFFGAILYLFLGRKTRLKINQ